MMPKANGYGIFFVAVGMRLLLAVAGCDLLQTREPEQPGGPGATFIPPTDPNFVITNLRSAIKEKNKENYRRCLADETSLNKPFQFEPTGSAQSRFQAEFSSWTIFSEEQYFRNLAASKPEGTSRLDLFDPTMNQSADSTVFNAKYHLIFQHKETSVGLADEARGRLEFFLALDTRGYWYIYRWIDYPDTSETTWSHFKGTFLTGGF